MGPGGSRTLTISGSKRRASNVAAGGVVVNDYLKSVSNPNFYACRDAAEVGPPLTPGGLYQGALAAENMINGNQRNDDHRNIPGIVFTIPPLGAVGLLETEARNQK